MTKYLHLLCSILMIKEAEFANVPIRQSSNIPQSPSSLPVSPPLTENSPPLPPIATKDNAIYKMNPNPVLTPVTPPLPLPPKKIEVTTFPPPESTSISHYLFSLGGAIHTLAGIVPEDYRPNATEVTSNAEYAFERIQDIGKLLFCNPFFAGINPGSCVLLHNATIIGLQG